jgi:hypothetical protein
VPLCPPQIAHGLALARTRSSAVRGTGQAQAVSSRPLAAETRVSECGIYAGQNALGQGFLRVLRFFPVSIIPLSYIIWGMNSRSVRGRSSENVSLHRHEQQQQHRMSPFLVRTPPEQKIVTVPLKRTQSFPVTSCPVQCSQSNRVEWRSHVKAMKLCVP